MAQITGIGGVFIFANDPKMLADWYTQYLGIHFQADEGVDGVFMLFYYRDVANPTIRFDTTFAILPARKHLGSERGECMINYRVDDLDVFVAGLRAANIATEDIKVLRDEEGYGKFTRLVDPEGNRIELYQPIR